MITRCAGQQIDNMKRNEFIKNAVVAFMGFLIQKRLIVENGLKGVTIKNRSEGETTMAVSECKWEECDIQWVESANGVSCCFVKCKPGRFRLIKN